MSKEFNDRGPFKAGEVCVIVGSDLQPRFNGCDVLIEGVLGSGFYDVDVKHPDGGRWFAREDRLRRKRPPTTGEDLIRSMFDAPPQRVPEVA